MFPQWWTYSALFRILKILVRLFVLLQFEIFLYFVFCSLFFWWLHFNDIQCSFNFENNDCNSKKKLLLADFDKKHQLQCCDTYFIIISLCAISLSMLHVHISYYTIGCDLILQVVCFTFFGLCKDVNYGTQLKKSHSISYLFCTPFFVLF